MSIKVVAAVVIFIDVFTTYDTSSRQYAFNHVMHIFRSQIYRCLTTNRLFPSEVIDYDVVTTSIRGTARPWFVVMLPAFVLKRTRYHRNLSVKTLFTRARIVRLIIMMDPPFLFCFTEESFSWDLAFFARTNRFKKYLFLQFVKL